MASVTAKPYLSLRELPTTPVINFEHNGLPLGNTSEIPGWDYESNLKIFTVIGAKTLISVIEKCQLPDEAKIVTYLKWTSTTVSLTAGTSDPVLLSNKVLEISASPNSKELGGRLLVSLVIALAEDINTDNSTSPSRKGSILWESKKHLLTLEGDLDRFPVVPVNFAENKLDNDCAWTVRWLGSDLDSTASSSVQLLLNTNHKNYHRLKSPSGEKDPLLLILKWDVASQMIERALNDANFDDREDWVLGSIGDTLNTQLRAMFGDISTASVREMRNNSPHEYHSKLQSNFNILGSFSNE